ncbi:MAG: hypothetical protein EZS28_046917, partial [Streblomastix strix]
EQILRIEIQKLEFKEEQQTLKIKAGLEREQQLENLLKQAQQMLEESEYAMFNDNERQQQREMQFRNDKEKERDNLIDEEKDRWKFRSRMSGWDQNRPGLQQSQSQGSFQGSLHGFPSSSSIDSQSSLREDSPVKITSTTKSPQQPIIQNQNRDSAEEQLLLLDRNQRNILLNDKMQELAVIVSELGRMPAASANAMKQRQRKEELTQRQEEVERDIISLKKSLRTEKEDK